MRAASLVILAATAALAVPAPVPQDDGITAPDSEVPSDPAEALQLLDSLGEAAYQLVQDNLNTTVTKRAGGCTLSTLKVRREWGSLSGDQRRSYISAVKCLQSKPSRLGSLAPGAQSRYDDFIAVHIQQTMEIHYTGNFLSWHRYFTWLYEKALREECGYTGTQPYWNWGISAITGLENSPIFDGSDTSLSGNGESIPSKGPIVIGAGPDLPPLILPSGTGGGCVTSGPFQNMSLNLGPVSLDTPEGVLSNPAGPLAYNPRCLKRDLTTEINRMYANATSTVKNIILPQDINSFQMTMQGIPGSGNIGIHGGGHYSMGGDPGRDFFVSPGDPAFYLHHAMIDRVWTTWQLLSPRTRTKGTTAVAGTRTFMNQPPSDATTIEDLIDISWAGGDGSVLPIKDLLSTTDGPFCYIYL